VPYRQHGHVPHALDVGDARQDFDCLVHVLNVKCTCLDVVMCVPGCVKKASSDTSKHLCIPAGVTGTPSLSSATIKKYNDCKNQGSFSRPDCKDAENNFYAGTGCLEECRAEHVKQQQRSRDFCDGLDFWECIGAPAPCSGALPPPPSNAGVVSCACSATSCTCRPSLCVLTSMLLFTGAIG
jgi:hypothetical protein